MNRNGGKCQSEIRIGDSRTSGSDFDVAPDGKRIAALMTVETPEAQKSLSHVIFLENFGTAKRRSTKTKTFHEKKNQNHPSPRHRGCGYVKLVLWSATKSLPP